MPQCVVCDELLQPEQKSCHVCGSHVVAAAEVPLTSPTLKPLTNSGMLHCSECGQSYSESGTEEFCPCGAELPRQVIADEPPLNQLPPATPPSDPLPAPNESESLPGTDSTVRPPVGTVCIVLYSDTKPRVPVQYFPVAKDVLLIGRQDAIRGDFPDVDLGSLVDAASSRKISRRHAEILRARDSQTFSLRPLPGNTGTQIGKDLAADGQSYTLTDGTPIVLGGVVWMKFETIV